MVIAYAAIAADAFRFIDCHCHIISLPLIDSAIVIATLRCRIAYAALRR
jgi:hypothetical protein